MFDILKGFRVAALYNKRATYSTFIPEKNEILFENETTKSIQNEIEETIKKIESKAKELKDYKISFNEINTKIEEVIKNHTDGNLTEEQMSIKLQDLKQNKQELKNSIDIDFINQVSDSLNTRLINLRQELVKETEYARLNCIADRFNSLSDMLPSLRSKSKALEVEVYKAVQIISEMDRIKVGVFPNSHIALDKVEIFIENLESFLKKIPNRDSK